MTAASFFHRLMPTNFPHEFNRRAAQYEQHAPVQREAAAWLAEWLPEKIESPALEVGAGTGFFTRHLAGRTDHLVASDISPRMVETGRRALPEIRWVVADATTPPGEGRYHGVFSCSLVQWLSDPAAAFRAWRHAAAPGARLVSGWFLRGTMGELFTACPEAAPFLWRDADEWKHLLAESGWTIRRDEAKSFVRHHTDSVAMLREVHNAGAVIPRRIGGGQLRRALREYDRDHRSEAGVRSTFNFLRVEAVRA